MKVEDIVKSYLMCSGYDGLFNDGGGCGCTLDDFAPCEGVCTECEPGYKFDCGNCKNSPANGGSCDAPGEFEDTFIVCKDKNTCAPFRFDSKEEA